MVGPRTNPSGKRKWQVSGYRLWLFFGSMDLAVLLLIAIAMASVAGTILKQNQPYTDYLSKFGPFWHEVYQALGLYDVYASAWFMAGLVFLVSSTTVCVIGNAPGILRRLGHRPRSMSETALRRYANCCEYTVPLPTQQVGKHLQSALRGLGFRVHCQGTYLGATRGTLNRISYLLIHISIVLIGVGGLLDSSIALRLRIMSGEFSIERRDLPISEVPAHSIISNDHRSFRSSVLIPEGGASAFSFINIADGYLVQTLPFTVHLDDFRVEHYTSGQPKSFTSDLRIEDESGDSSHHTISVNHPLRYQGYVLYQSSFEDGGSMLDLVAYSLSGRGGTILNPDAQHADEEYIRFAPGEEKNLSGTIGRTLKLHTATDTYQLEFTDFRRFNIFPTQDQNQTFTDTGPRFQYILRHEDGSAREFQNYMQPVEIDGRYYMLSGVRTAPDAEFQFLYLPMDQDFSLRQFFSFHTALHDDALLAKVTGQIIPKGETPYVKGMNIEQAMMRFLVAFREDGFSSIVTFVRDHLPENEQEAALKSYTRVLQNMLSGVHQHVVSASDQSQWDEKFFQDTLLALSALSEYDAPVLLLLNDFQERQASGLQINRAPTARWVYLGFLSLVIGVFAMFYIAHQRLFILLQVQGNTTRILLAGDHDRRHSQVFVHTFTMLKKEIAGWQHAGSTK